jgi:hypothetical protein
MTEIEIKLPEVSTWTKSILIDAGIPVEAKYSSLRFMSGGRQIGQSAKGYTDTLIGRLICIKGRSGSTDAKINHDLSGILTVTMIATIN